MILHDFDENNFDDEISNGIVLVDFYATWCGPCKMITPELEELVKNNPNIKVIKVDVDKYHKITDKFRIMSVPTLLLYNDGKLLGNRSGFMPLNIILEWINELTK